MEVLQNVGVYMVTHLSWAPRLSQGFPIYIIRSGVRPNGRTARARRRAVAQGGVYEVDELARREGC
jgi:hypothetical protein